MMLLCDELGLFGNGEQITHADALLLSETTHFLDRSVFDEEHDSFSRCTGFGETER